MQVIGCVVTCRFRQREPRCDYARHQRLIGGTFVFLAGYELAYPSRMTAR